MFIAALFAIAKTWKETKCPSTEKWIKKLWYIHAMECYSAIKSLPSLWETWVQSLGQEDPLGKEMATHSSILVWTIPWTEEPSGLQSMGSQRARYD